MGNSKFNISKEAKNLIDELKISLDINDTPVILKLALAKGISLIQTEDEVITKFDGSGTWLVPENVIKDPDYILFKHLIINERNTVISDADINKYFAFYIEKGIREINKLITEKTTFDDIRMLILN